MPMGYTQYPVVGGSHEELLTLREHLFSYLGAALQLHWHWTVEYNCKPSHTYLGVRPTDDNGSYFYIARYQIGLCVSFSITSVIQM